MTDEEKKYEKEQWKKMTPAQKFQHFRTYYLWQTLAAAGAVIAVIWFVLHILSPHETTVLGVYVFDDYLNEITAEELTEKLREEIGVTDSHEIVFLSGGYSDSQYQSVISIQARQATNEVDLIIGKEETFRRLTGVGYMEPLDDMLDHDFLESMSDRIVEAAGPAEEESLNEPFEIYPEGKGEVKRYGIRLNGSEVWKNLVIGGDDDYIAAVSAGSLNSANIEIFFRELFPD